MHSNRSLYRCLDLMRYISGMVGESRLNENREYQGEKSVFFLLLTEVEGFSHLATTSQQ